MSELAADPAAPPPAKAVVAKLVPNIPGGTAYKALRPADLASAPAGSAIVIVTLRGDRSALGASDASWGMFAMERVTEKYDPLLPSGEVLLARLKRGRTSKSEGQEATFIFAVPPGKWRLAGHRGVDPCMGAPSFEVAAGEAVFLGAFDFNATPFAPALDMGPARTALNADPGLSNRLRPAHWVNGSTAYCRGWYLYALEFDGFPFEDGYVWGSRSPR